MLNLITKVGIYNPDTNEEVVLTNIMDGVDGSAAFSYQEESDAVMIEDGQTLDHSIGGTLDIKVLRASDADLAIIDSVVGKRAYVAAITVNGFLMFSGLHYITRVPDFNSSIVNDNIRLTFKSIKGYVPGTNQKTSYGGLNPLMMYDILNGYDNGSSNIVLGGFEPKFTSADHSVSNGVQTVTTTAAGSGGIRTPLDQVFYFPFTDRQFNLSVEYISGTGSADLQVGIAGRDQPDSGSSNIIQGTGNSGRIVAVWDFESVRATKRFFRFEIDAPIPISSTVTYEFTKPAIRLGTTVSTFAY